MVKSMTGYGRTSNEFFTIEIQSVNHRFCEISLKSPSQIFLFENKIKDLIKSKVSRGKFYVFVGYEKGSNIILDKQLAKESLKQWQELGAEMGLQNDLKLSHLLNMKDIATKTSGNNHIEASWPHLKKALLKGLNNLLAMREEEGKKIELEFNQRLKILDDLVNQLMIRAPQVPLLYKERLEAKIKELMAKEVVDELRLVQEVAIYADKCDITEELVRLQSHVRQFEETLRQSEAIGRSLDFLAQEINRELNTIGSKANDLQMIQLVLKGKNELEKIKEQIANVE